MKTKLNIIILSHGEFGFQMYKSAELIIGKIEDIHAFSLTKEMSLGDLITVIDLHIQKLEGKVVILTDLFGGTPNNAAMYLQQKYQCEVVSGMNLPLLLDLVISRDNSDKTLDELLNDCILSGKDAISRQQITEHHSM